MKHLVLVTAPYGKGRGVDGGPAHVEEPRSALAEALVRELARAMGNGVSIGVERPDSGRAVVAALKGNLHNTWGVPSARSSLSSLPTEKRIWWARQSLASAEMYPLGSSRRCMRLGLTVRLWKSRSSRTEKSSMLDPFHRCWQDHRASWPVGVGIIEPTLYPDSG